jgi:spoIIIJ-associated protein
MPPTLEIEGKTVDQAVQKACQRLNISREKLQYDVVSYGSTGIFGLGRTRNARIRVRMTEENASSKDGVDDRFAEKEAVADTEVEQAEHPNASDTLSTTGSSLDSGDAVDLGREVLQRIVDSITDDARIRVEQQPERIDFQVDGGNSAILIGRHGQTLEAIQSLVEKVVNKNNHNRISVQVDVGGYLQNRKKRLIRNAERLAQKCQRTQKPVSAGLLNAHDRRIVHLALKDHRSVRTRSTGDGLLRNLMILPSKSADRWQRKR